MMCCRSRPSDTHNWRAEQGETEPAAQQSQLSLQSDCRTGCTSLMAIIGWAPCTRLWQWISNAYLQMWRIREVRSIRVPLFLWADHRPLLFLLMLFVEVREGEGTISVNEGIEHPNIESAHCVSFFQNPCALMSTNAPSSLLAVLWCDAVFHWLLLNRFTV